MQVLQCTAQMTADESVQDSAWSGIVSLADFNECKRTVASPLCRFSIFQLWISHHNLKSAMVVISTI